MAASSVQKCPKERRSIPWTCMVYKPKKKEEGITFQKTYVAVVKAMSFGTLFAINARRELSPLSLTLYCRSLLL
jgi:hypothetical protein